MFDALTRYTQNMLKRMIFLLWTITYCTIGASVPEKCVQCSLSFDEAPELRKHQSLLVIISCHLQNISEMEYTVSNLCDGHHCSVQGCFLKDSQYDLELYTKENNQVYKRHFNKTNLQPDCGPKGISDRKDPNGADKSPSNKLVILLALCLLIVFHFERPT